MSHRERQRDNLPWSGFLFSTPQDPPVETETETKTETQASKTETGTKTSKSQVETETRRWSSRACETMTTMTHGDVI